jgi:uncharacterized protein DUF5946
MGSKVVIAEPCSGCGFVVQGGTEGCQEIFERLGARDFGNAAYFRVHRLMVDTFSLQHPDRYCKSAKSFAAHFTGLCVILEKGASPAVGNERLRRWLDGKPKIAKPPPPAFRGKLTVGDVDDASDPDTYAADVARWARSTWEAYASLHPLAREWIASSARRPPGRRNP